MELSGQNHLLGAVQTGNVDGLGGANGIATTGAEVFPCAGCSGRQCGGGTAVSSGARDVIAADLIPIYQNVGQVIVQTEL